MLANAETRWSVLAALDTLLGHIANGRLSETMACFTADADVTLLGSDLEDRCLGPEAIRAHFAALYAQPFRVLFDFPERRVSAHGHIAWLAAEGSYRLSNGDGEGPYRLAGVLERRQDRWLWQLFSGSEPR
jgi:ketosteroid isomerase-like protein